MVVCFSEKVIEKRGKGTSPAAVRASRLLGLSGPWAVSPPRPARWEACEALLRSLFLLDLGLREKLTS